MQTRTTKVVMIVDSVSPTPFSLLRRAKNFEYRDDDRALQQFSAYEDTVKALTDECRRVLECIANANQSVMSPVSPDPKTPDPSWSRFEDFGFSGIMDSSASTNGTSLSGSPREFSSVRSGAHSKTTDFGRPTTPSWADFLSSGFADENNQSPPNTLMLPSQKLPPLGEGRVHSSQSHMRHGLNEDDLEPGELASITQFDLDETFWWVWMISLASEETTERKAAFGRCTLIETRIKGAKWLVMEEQVKGASPGPEEGAYIAEKKSKFSFTRRGRLGRRKSTGKKPPVKDPYSRTTTTTPMSKTSIGPDQHARIQAAAAKLAQNERDQKNEKEFAQRRGRQEDTSSVKTNSVLTLQPHLVSDAGPAMQWDKKFGEAALDRDALRAQYLGDFGAGRGSKSNLMTAANGRSSPLPPEISNRDLPALPKSVMEAPSTKRGDSRSPARVETNTPEQSVTPVPWPHESPTPTPLPQSQTFPKPMQEDESYGTPIEETPFATPLPIPEEKSSTPAVTPNQHPALRKPVPERKAIVSRQPSVRVSEDKGKKPSPNKLKKKEGGGFRKMFGRKKTETPAPAAVAAPMEAAHPTQPEEDSYFQASDAVRSMSRVDDHQAHVREPSPTYSDKQPDPLRAPSPKYEPSPAASTPDYSETHHATPLAPGAPATQQEIDRAFSRFDQGPMDDMPAFAPTDDDSSDDAAVAPNIHRRPQPLSTQQSRPRTPTQQAPQHADDISEESLEFSKQASPSQDRWAQIRKNAADRAARLSEEQTRRSRSQSQSQRTDEGETSGEETIESRVARIKARVAELTGNVDGQPTGAATGRQW
jgi:hypothetical protein